MPGRIKVGLSSGTMIATVMLMIAPGISVAHKHVCIHTHAGGGDSVVTCANTVSCSQDGNTGNCKSEQGTSRVWCRCTADGGGDDTEPGKGCNSSASWYFDDQLSGLPSANNPIIYLAAGDNDNFVSTSFGGGVVGPEFDAKSNAMQGTFSLFFGAFSDPQNIPVMVEDVSISFPEVGAGGASFFELPDGAVQHLVYDSKTRKIDTVDSQGIELWVSNDLMSNVPVTLNLQATIDVNGGLHGFAQLAVHQSIFIDGFLTGDVSNWSAQVRAEKTTAQ